MKGRETEGDKLIRKATALCKPSLLEMRFRPDWNGAAPLYEQAANSYRAGQCWEKARVAWEKAASCQEQLGSPWHAAKMLEKAADAAKELQDYESVATLLSVAAESYFEAGRPQAGSEALYKAAQRLETPNPAKATELYAKAMAALEQDERFSIGPDLYRSAVSHELRHEAYAAATSLLMQYAAISEQRNLSVSVCRAYLGALVVCLYDCKTEDAVATFNDTATVDTFRKSDEYRSAEALLDAYRQGSSEAIKRVVADGIPFQFLDTAVARLAQKLPMGDVAEMAKRLEVRETVVHEEDDLT